VTVPAGYGAGGQRIASYAYSDWAALSSQARTDGGTGYLLVGRTWVTSASTVKQMSSAQAAAFVAAGKTVGWASNADGTGAYVTSPNANPKTPSTGGGFVTIPAYYEFLRTSARGVKILASGDSLMSGYDGSAFALPWVDQAVNSISTITTGPVDLTNVSFSGNAMYAICQRAINAMNWIRPDIIVLPVYSPNDIGSNATSAYIGWEMVLNTVNEALRLGVVPVLVTGMPSNLSTSIDAARININTYARQMFPNNIIDLDAMMTNGATPARLNATYNSGDNVHLTAAGYTQIATGTGMSVPNAATRLSTIISNNLL
jgi:lysophospholipase L1-like esterase